MKITDILSRYSVNSEKTRAKTSHGEGEAGAAGATKAAEDSVTVSSIGKNLQRVPRILEEDAANQEKRIAALKEKYANGDYPSSLDVAQSIVDHFSRNG